MVDGKKGKIKTEVSGGMDPKKDSPKLLVRHSMNVACLMG